MHNESLNRLDALTQANVLSRQLPLQATAANGDFYLVPTGDAQDGQFAVWIDGAFIYAEPKTGWHVYVADEARFLVFDGSDWIAQSVGSRGAPNLLINSGF